MKLKLCASIALAMVASIAAVQGQEAYVIGISTALTGPGASTVAGAAEGLKLYVERLNKAGGINGRKVDLIIQDDQGEPSKAAANAKKLLSDNVSLLINTSECSAAVCGLGLPAGRVSAGERVPFLHDLVLGRA